MGIDWVLGGCLELWKKIIASLKDCGLLCVRRGDAWAVGPIRSSVGHRSPRSGEIRVWLWHRHIRYEQGQVRGRVGNGFEPSKALVRGIPLADRLPSKTDQCTSYRSNALSEDLAGVPKGGYLGMSLRARPPTGLVA